jgi:hypothetical protein
MPTYIQVERRKESNAFCLDSTIPQIESIKKIRYYSDVLPDKTKWKVTKQQDYLYDMKQIFENPIYEVRRGIKLTERKEISIIDIPKQEKIPIPQMLVQEWETHKKADPKVYQMLFDAKRYLRCFDLKEQGFNIYQKLILVDNQPYGIICFSIENNIAFELAFVSLYWKKELKIINDLNECILLNCFYDLYKNYGIEKINPGTDAGIKGLKILKSKFPAEKLVYYSFISKEVDKKEISLFN